MSLFSLNPSYRVVDWPAARPLMLEMLDATAHDPGCYHCGFARSGDRLVWRSQFDDVDVLARNMRALGPLMNRMMAEAATLDSLELHAAPSAMQSIKAVASELGLPEPQFFEDTKGLSAGFLSKSTAGSSSKEVESKLVTVAPKFSVSDWTKAKPIMQRFVDSTDQEDGCQYFGWLNSEDTNTMQWKGVYADGDAAKKHLSNVIPLVNDLIKGPATASDASYRRDEYN